MADIFLLSDFLSFFKVFWIPLIPSWSVHLLFILLVGPGPAISNNLSQSLQKCVGPAACNCANLSWEQVQILQVNM